MSGPDISHQIAGLIEVTEGIAEAYDPIKDLRGLPEAFQEVNKLLPLVEQTLRDAKSPAKKFKSDDDAKALETLLYSCDEKADKLLEIFRRIAKNSKDQYDSSVYRAIIIKQGKHRVETLMDGILEDLGALVAHHIFPAEMQRQVEPLADAREELAKVSPSLADSDLAEQPGAANQYGDNSRQYNLFGEGTQKIADGHYFEAHGHQNFGMVPPKESVERKLA
ncbi:hypothetical protein EYZ11_009966 [Aspergillus tanneri]|uniref:NACHT-NTPase and P-loop NTPases N-terminal domain-containing protein n=1 Tax=Aspergillus tanneri TaxID=1220188 RepID=A0A4S3J6T0_9EURO|nr:uncharacterized protein ATNIH1004_011321 [Aspergillus tanneri]KAA8642377.1 hypothetical protein ATNIH1004_011321 [Aspergillus tanneri]THC90565.1 hypothetical protein EYZ11_009966 [Aspergillus tanneri]